ncbi:MAG: TonB-dependent receptor [Algicola sp.]|nr:TonB-dependent receptor [Algicola sp.]
MNFRTLIRYTTITCAFISAQVIFAVAGATAQFNLDNPFNLTIEQLLAVNISVASRPQVSLSKAPASVTVYSGDDIKRMGITNLEALLNHDPIYSTTYEDQARLKINYGQLSFAAGWIARVYSDFVQGGVVGNGVNKLERTARYLQLKYQHLFFDDLAVTVFAEHYRVSQDELVLLFPWEIAQTHPFGWTDGSAHDLLLPYQRTIQGLYAQSRWQINDKIQLTTGFGYDYYEDVGDNLSLRTGLVYEIDDQQNVKLLYGEAFRAPSIGDTKAEFSSAVVGNPDLQPELVKTIDVIWQKAWMDFALTINGFFNTIDDEIVVEVRQPLPGFNALQPTNKGQQHLSGLELELQANINATIALKSGLSYFNHEQTLERRMVK